MKNGKIAVLLTYHYFSVNFWGSELLIFSLNALIIELSRKKSPWIIQWGFLVCENTEHRASNGTDFVFIIISSHVDIFRGHHSQTISDIPRVEKCASAKACVCESVHHRKRVLGVAKRPREISSAQPRRQNSCFFRKKTKSQKS